MLAPLSNQPKCHFTSLRLPQCLIALQQCRGIKACTYGDQKGICAPIRIRKKHSRRQRQSNRCYPFVPLFRIVIINSAAFRQLPIQTFKNCQCFSFCRFASLSLQPACQRHKEPGDQKHTSRHQLPFALLHSPSRLNKLSTNSFLSNTCRSVIFSPTPMYFTGILN